MLQNKEGLWNSNDTWNFRNHASLDDLRYIENIDKTKVWGIAIDGKVILENFEKDKAEQLWKKGESNTEGYFQLEGFTRFLDSQVNQVPKVITAISSSELEMKGNIILIWNLVN